MQKRWKAPADLPFTQGFLCSHIPMLSPELATCLMGSILEWEVWALDGFSSLPVALLHAAIHLHCFIPLCSLALVRGRRVVVQVWGGLLPVFLTASNSPCADSDIWC